MLRIDKALIDKINYQTTWLIISSYSAEIVLKSCRTCLMKLLINRLHYTIDTFFIQYILLHFDATFKLQ